MTLNPNHIYQTLVEAGDEWADANSAADLLEEVKKTVLSEIALHCEEKTSAAKETYALSHPDFKEHIHKMVEARRIANRKKVKFDGLKLLAELRRTESANMRAADRHAT